ncbi:MAG: hypothetical protein V4733_06155 [Verrucomicrobiota bacterium]
MKITPDSNNLDGNDSWGTDDLWDLLGKAPPPTAGPRFTECVTRAARLLPTSRPWWRHAFAPVSITAAAAAAIILTMLAVFTEPAPTVDPVIAVNSTAAEELAELAAAETLSAAADHLDSFSDRELASLIGL